MEDDWNFTKILVKDQNPHFRDVVPSFGALYGRLKPQVYVPSVDKLNQDPPPDVTDTWQVSDETVELSRLELRDTQVYEHATSKPQTPHPAGI